MNSLEDLVNKVLNEYKSFDISTVHHSNKCYYDPTSDTICLNFEVVRRYLDYFKILHELAHKVQKDLSLLYGNTTAIELNANKIASEAYKKLGFPLTFEVTRHINYNNLKQLSPDMTDREIKLRIANQKELIWRL